ncbi:hypothetical protein LNTAR_13242 [Lentisphaera araneosa HTCC2155]|uniref:Protein arginine N-methyltransferase domain-containing protein n=1 Tax=Lentisphaera araneosa HTCC2155 TaxID=313628 RepID=A6DRP7_9BACT|nr:50S ribosomal protein L11 methyltransferase [Lentisphaera araneosa]EDM25716.1 hypothetical protein LNTAR_13242 [Lentisphaera araneosa HTCC2155]
MNPEQILQTNKRYEIIASSRRQVKVIINKKTYYLSDSIFSILAVTTLPISYNEIIQKLTTLSSSHSHWVQLTTTLNQAINIGLITSPDNSAIVIGTNSANFDSAPVHIRMLNDKTRTLAYQKAIREVVSENDIVVDIGTGTGVLAITAAQAGAKHVYAIEATELGKVAERNFAKNRLNDKITLLEGLSTEIHLPEKASVLVSEIIGNDPLNERIIPTTKDACKRLLKPEARLIPQTLEIYLLPLTVPTKLINKYFFTKRTCSDWKNAYQIDFSELLNTPTSNRLIELGSHKCKDFPTFSEPLLISKIVLSKISNETLSIQGSFKSQIDGVLNGFLIYFNSKLSPHTLLTLHPNESDSRNNWGNSIYVLESAQVLYTNQTVNFTYSFKNNQSSIVITDNA